MAEGKCHKWINNASCGGELKLSTEAYWLALASGIPFAFAWVLPAFVAALDGKPVDVKVLQYIFIGLGIFMILLSPRFLICTKCGTKYGGRHGRV